MPAIVNISPRVLPRATPMDASGVIEAADLLYEKKRNDELMAARAAELEAGRQHDIDMLGRQGTIESGHIQERGGVEGGLIDRRGEVEGNLIERRGEVEGDLIDRRGRVEADVIIPAQGDQARRTDREGYELRADERSDARALQERAVRADELRATSSYNQSVFDMERARRAELKPTGNDFPLSGLARDLAANDLLIDPETGDMSGQRLQDLMGVAAGDTAAAGRLLGAPAGETSGGRTRTPPPPPSTAPAADPRAATAAPGRAPATSARGGSMPGMGSFNTAPIFRGGRGQPTQNGGMRFDTPGGPVELDPATISSIQSASPEENAQFLLMIPDAETRDDFLSLLPADMQAAVMQLLQGGG